MKTLLLTLAILSSNTTLPTDRFIGIAENSHYIINTNNEGYYIEEELGIHKDDTVLILNDEVYVIDCSH